MAMNFFRRGRDDRASVGRVRPDLSPWATEAGFGVATAEGTPEAGAADRPAHRPSDPETKDTGPASTAEHAALSIKNDSAAGLGSLFRPSRKETPMISTSLHPDGHTETCIGAGSHIVGTLNFENTVRIEGTVEGDISAQDSIVVGAGAVVKAQLTADTIVVTGKVTGDLIARRRVEIQAPGELQGNITTPSLVIHDGVVFEGRCSMGRPTAESPSRTTKPYKNGGIDRTAATP